MSIKIMSAVWDSEITDIYEASVLLALADHADSQGNCYPSVPRIARKARCSERKAQGVIQTLQERGYLEIKPNAGPKGTNRFRIIIPHLTPAHHAPRTPCAPHTASNTPAHRADEPSGNVNNKNKRARQFPENWMPSPKTIEGLLAKGYDKAQIGHMVEDCVNYHTGKGNTFKDHNAAFRMWASNQIKFHGTPEEQRRKANEQHRGSQKGSTVGKDAAVNSIARLAGLEKT